MGRFKKYNTDDEKIKVQRKWASEYYHRNKTEINKKTMEKYYEKNSVNRRTKKDNN